MAITATFKADFTSFVNAVEQAKVKLKTFEDGAASVDRQLAKFGNDFSGVKVAQQATLMIKAMQEAGGMAALTDKELKRLGATVGEASEKMRKMGVDVPPGFQKITEAANALKPASDGIAVSFGKLVASFVSAQAIIAALKTGFHELVAFVTDSIKAAGDAEKAHAQLVAALRAQGTAIPSVISAYEGYAKELQRTTIFQDDAIEGAIALMVQIGNVMPRDMEKALKATTNLASGLGIDLETATRMVAKAAEGNITALQKTGVQLDEATKKSGDFGKVLDAVNEKFGGQAAALASTYQGRLQQLGNTWNDLQESIGRVITQNATILKAFELLNGEIDKNTGELKENRAVTNLVSDAVILAVRAMAEFAKVLDLVQTGGAGFILFVRRTAQLLGNLGTIALQAARGMALLHGDLGAMRAATEGINSLQAAVKELGERNQRTQDSSNAFGNALQAVGARADVLVAELEKTRGKTVALTDVTDGSANAWDRHTKAIANTGDAAKKAQKDFEAMAQAMIDLQDETDRVFAGLLLDVNGRRIGSGGVTSGPGQLRLPTIGGVFGNGAAQNPFGGSFPAAGPAKIGSKTFDSGPGPAGLFGGVSAELKRFGDEWGSFGKISDNVMKGFVQNIGAMLSGGVLSLVGKGIDLLFSGFKKLFGKSEESAKVSPLRDEFFKLQGGLDVLNPKVVALTGNLKLVDAVFKAKTVDQYNAAIKELTDLLGFQDKALGDLTATAQKYGFTLEELGPALQRQNLDKQAQELFKDFQVLNAGGLDQVAILTRMSTSANEYLQNALKFGIEVPAAMKPMLDAMAKQGLLTDAAGNKIEDLESAGVSFALTMSEGFQALIKEVQKLTNAIAVGLGLAIENIPEPTITVHTKYDTSGIENSPDYSGFNRDQVGDVGAAMGGTITPFGLQYFASGSRGRILPFFRPRGTDVVPAMLTPGETVRTKSQESALQSRLAGGGAPNVTIHIDQIITSGDPQSVAESLKTAMENDTARIRTAIEITARKAIA